MDKKQILQFGLLVFIGMLIWGPAASSLTRLLLPDADTLQIYLFNKGLFVVLLLAVMSKFGGLKFYGIERGSSWWFLVPGPAHPAFDSRSIFRSERSLWSQHTSDCGLDSRGTFCRDR